MSDPHPTSVPGQEGGGAAIPLDDDWLDLFDRGSRSYLEERPDGTVVFSEGFSLSQLLAFLSDAPMPPTESTADAYRLDFQALADAPITVIPGICYSERDLIRALIAEVRRIREEST